MSGIEVASGENLTLTQAELEVCRPMRGEGGRVLRAFCFFHGGDRQRSLRVDQETGRFHCFACGAWGYMDWARERWREERTPGTPGGPKLPGAPTPSNGSPSLPGGSPLLKGSPTKWGGDPHASQERGEPTRVEARDPAPGPGRIDFRRGSWSPRPPAQPGNGSRSPKARRSGSTQISFPSSAYKGPEGPPEPARTDLAELLASYQEALPGSPGEAYLRQRGIPLGIARRYGVGYAALGKWAHPARDWKGGRLVFPHTNPDGRLINLYGRAVGADAEVPKGVRHDHLPGSKGYFNAVALQEGEGPLFVCEGAFDLLSLMAAGVSRGVAIYGVDGWRWDWAREVRRIVFALDADPAGGKWKELARQGCLRGKRVGYLTPDSYGGHKDVNEAWAAGVLALGDWPADPEPAVEKAPESTPQEDKTGCVSSQAPSPEASGLAQDSERFPEGASLKVQDLIGEEPAGASVCHEEPPSHGTVHRQPRRKKDFLRERDPAFFWMRADGTCSRCAGQRAWRSIHGVITCATCHPPANPELVAEWIEWPTCRTGKTVP